MSNRAQAAGALPDEGPEGSPLQIFINYRHEDMPFAASTLYRELKGQFGPENIFFDGGTLKPGMPFLEEIKSHLGSPPGAFLALIGPKWQTTMIDHRQKGDEDYVIKEIGLALQNDWTVIPVLVNEASLPDPSLLTPAVRSLPDYQAARLRQTSLDNDIEDLKTLLSELSARASDRAYVQVRDEEAIEPPEERVKISAPEVRPADDEHYQNLVDEADNLVIFLGAGVNSDDHDGPFQPVLMFPDDTDLADYLAVKARLRSGQRELAEVAQYARMVKGEPNVFKWVKQILAVDSEPGPVHKYLARLPKRQEELGLPRRYQMIVTPKFDVALEKAFRNENEPFDVAVYMAPGTEHEGKFVHVPWTADPQPIIKPNEYDKFPIVGDEGELTRTVIVRINGTVDDLKTGYTWKRNFVITEDHYIDYLVGRTAEEVVPGQILAKLRQASCLFLGYAIADWRLRVFLRWIWRGETLGGATHWAVQRNPDILERQFWQRSGVALYRSRLTDYVQGLDSFLQENRDELI